jgi:prepilin-type processing-associated H-X9-DG protein
MGKVVVVAILVLVGVLVVGLLPVAAFKSKAASDRTQCMNNLRNIGLAIHNYQTLRRGKIPRAAEPNPALPLDQRFSWLVSIGPYLEAEHLYTRMDRQKSWDADENRYLALTSYPVFYCPSYPDRPSDSPFAPTHYVGIAGLGADAASLPLTDPRAGLFGYERQPTIADITGEGRLSTLLIAVETGRVSGAWTAAGPPTVRGVEDDPPYFGPGGQFGGAHGKVVNVVFGDGSVRGLQESITPGVFEALATLRGSKRADPDKND